eukprot:EG_transcript_9130
MWGQWRHPAPRVPPAPSPPPLPEPMLLSHGVKPSAMWTDDRQYGAVFLALFALLVAALSSRRSQKAEDSPAFVAFQRKFLAVYLIMFAGDWMQASTTYAVYASYGFSRAECGGLFLGGYVTSMLMGPFCGAFADRFGRKLSCLLYAATHIFASAVKHSDDFHTLLLGSSCGGVATALLWSCFEPWMVTEHRRRQFDERGLAQTFSLMATWNFLVAIPSGLAAHGVVQLTGGRLVAPFDLSVVTLCCGSCLCLWLWTENYGEGGGEARPSLRQALGVALCDSRVLRLGLLQALFEGAMYTFVFLWTPAMSQAGHSIPHGVVFSAFMVSCALGGCLFSFLVRRVPVEALMIPVLCLAAGSLAVPVFVAHPLPLLGAFCAFEFTVGLFWPAMGSMRSAHLPDTGRATLMGLFRVPLNMVVCTVLVVQGWVPIPSLFALCTAGLLCCVAVQSTLYWAVHRSPDPKAPFLAT